MRNLEEPVPARRLSRADGVPGRWRSAPDDEEGIRWLGRVRNRMAPCGQREEDGDGRSHW